MAKRYRVDIRGILADPDLRRELMVPAIQATQAREGIDTTREQAERAYYVVTEAERAAFFDLEQFRGGRGEPDRRQEMFVKALGEEIKDVRFDVARRDFAAVEDSPLAYHRVGLVAHIFRDSLALDPAWGIAVVGLQTSDDPQFVRHQWEIPSSRIGEGKEWMPFAKGGEYSRFYADIYLVVQWTSSAIKVMQKIGRVQNVSHYLKPGLTWPLRTQRGFNLRVMPAGCVFGHKGPAVFPAREDDSLFILGVANSAAAEYLLGGLMSFGSWEVGVIKRLPIPQPTSKQHQRVGAIAKEIYAAKEVWDGGNETSTRFRKPWLLRDMVEGDAAIPARLDRLIQHEAAKEAGIQKLYAELNDEAYKLYGISEGTHAIIEKTLRERPAEVLWPQMEGKTAEQKRLEHVFRLLSYVIKCVVETDDDGIVSFTSTGSQLRLIDRVRHELSTLFPGHDVNQVEIDITNELKKSVKGYRKTNGIQMWLEDVFFYYHCSLYKSRPIIWHIASNQSMQPFAFGALVHYHKFDKNRMSKLRAHYVRDAMEHFRREAALALKEGRSEARVEWQARLEEAQELDAKLQFVQEGHHEGPEDGERDFRILTPWKSPAARPRGWDPDIDDGVKVNIEPLQKAGVLRVGKVV